jgi:predicted dehydrogenase
MLGFTNRRVPAVALGRRLIEQGRIGTIHHVRAQYLQDWLVDPATPLSWRLLKERAGSGSLGDLGAHCIDTALFWTGDSIREVVSSMKTFVTERPVGGDHSGLTFTATTDEMGPVTVDDSATFLAHFAGGAEGVFEATRFASGRKNALRIEVNGSLGSIAFDYEDMNILHFNDHAEGADTAGFRRILATGASHPYLSAWWPVGHGLGYDHAFSNQVFDLVTAIAAGVDPTPSFVDGLAVQRVLDAVETSAAQRSWQTV